MRGNINTLVPGTFRFGEAGGLVNKLHAGAPEATEVESGLSHDAHVPRRRWAENSPKWAKEQPKKDQHEDQASSSVDQLCQRTSNLL